MVEADATVSALYENWALQQRGHFVGAPIGKQRARIDRRASRRVAIGSGSVAHGQAPTQHHRQREPLRARPRLLEREICLLAPIRTSGQSGAHMGLDLIEVRADSPVLAPVITQLDQVLRLARKLSGMLGVTFFGLVFTPVFYVVIRTLATRAGKFLPHPIRDCH